jgi:hypothetical protein
MSGRTKLSAEHYERIEEARRSDERMSGTVAVVTGVLTVIYFITWSVVTYPWDDRGDIWVGLFIPLFGLFMYAFGRWYGSARGYVHHLK